jgi:6-pyruvoyltetrahydropterin/6-carboxytetrahydropterin synthase
MPRANLTRKTQFAAAHRYWRPEWSAQENQRVFGACANPHGHGHNYRLEVTVSARIDAQTGFSANMPELDDIIEREVRSVLDHQHLNHAVPEFAEGGLIPTSENILLWCWPRLKQALPAAMELKRLRLHEDESFYVDYFGEGES